MDDYDLAALSGLQLEAIRKITGGLQPAPVIFGLAGHQKKTAERPLTVQKASASALRSLPSVSGAKNPAAQPIAA